MLGTILLVLLVLFLVGALPTWPHSASWGYVPSGGIGLVVLVVLILLLLGRISPPALPIFATPPAPFRNGAGFFRRRRPPVAPVRAMISRRCVS